jgi:type II secretory pathway component PulJ
MLYMLKVYTLIATIVFGTTGIFLLSLLALSAAQDYARALRASFANSRTVSRTREMNSRSAA